MKRKVVSVVLSLAMVSSVLAGCGQKAETPALAAATEAAPATETETEAEAPAAEAEEGALTVNGGEPLELKVYTQYADDDTKVPYDYAVEQLAKDFPNVTLTLIEQAQDDGQTLKTLAATGQLPDIYQASTDIINTFRESNQIMVLNDVADKTGFSDKLFESTKSLAYAEDGNMYAFPFAGQEYVLWYYNSKLFADNGLEVPKTYDELENCIEVFKEAGITPLALFGQEGWNTAAAYDVIATRYNAGGIKALDEQSASIEDQAYVDATKMLEKLVADGLFQDGCTTTNYDNASAMFLNGEAAMFINGQWYIEDATAALGDDVDWMFYPAADEASYEKGKTAFSGGGSTSGFAVNAEGEHAEDAAIIAEYLAEKYCEAKVLKRHNPLVAIETGMTSETALPAMMQKLADTIPTMTSTTKFTWGLTNATFNDGIQAASQGLVSGEFTADDFLADMKEVVDEMDE